MTTWIYTDGRLLAHDTATSALLAVWWVDDDVGRQLANLLNCAAELAGTLLPAGEQQG